MDYLPPAQEIVTPYESYFKIPFFLKEIYEQIVMKFSEANVSQIRSQSGNQQEHLSLVLFIRPTCPYCQKVLNYLKSIGKKIPIRDIGQDSEALEELIRVGGKKQVPCLFINQKAHYESDWIINWIKENKDRIPNV